jgi:hypothetical protein
VIGRPRLPRPHLHDPHPRGGHFGLPRFGLRHFGRPHFGRPHPGPGMSLYLLSPLIAELVLGSSPPLVFAILSWTDIPMYGGGAILIRELALRWRKGWPTIIALGVAYAIAEEGIAIRTFFDPAASPLQGFKDYGWFGGANWVWIASMALYHSLVSIALPIMLVTMAFPDRAREPWVSTQWLRRAAAGLVGIVGLWLVVIYHPAVDGRLIVASVLAIGAIGLIARRLPAAVAFRPAAPPAPSPRRVVIVVAVSILGIFFVAVSKGLGGPPIVAIAGQLAIAALLLRWLGRHSAQPGWSNRQRFAVATGVFVCMWLFSPFVELTGGHGQVIVMLVGIWISRRVWRRLEAEDGAIPEPPRPLFAEMSAISDA